MYQYKKIKELLALRACELDAGTRLPSRPQLCRELQTTRTTLDRAISELNDDGILVSKKGSGTYVTGMLDGNLPHAENWGVIVPSATADIYPQLLRGIKEKSEQFGVNIIVCDTDSNLEKQEVYIKRLLASGVSGFIISPTVSKNAKTSYRLYGTLLQSNIPFIFCNREVEGIDVPTVKSTDFYGGYLATKLLLENGYTRICYIATQKYQTSIERCQGYINALLEQNAEIDRHLIHIPTSHQKYSWYYEKALEILNSSAPPDAFFCFNDSVAEQIYKAISDSGLTVGSDIGVIGYDDSPLASSLLPPLTSMSYKSELIGEKAAELLYKILRGEYESYDFKHYLFQPCPVIRQSCLKNKKEFKK